MIIGGADESGKPLFFMGEHDDLLLSSVAKFLSQSVNGNGRK